MRKIFLSLFALCTAVAANAFTLRMQNVDASDPEKRNVDVTEATNDVFGDGKVAVKFDLSNHEVIIEMNNATLCGTNAQHVFSFESDENYSMLTMIVKGTCAIEARGTYGNPLYLKNAALRIQSDNPNAVLNIKGNKIIAQVDGEGGYTLGNGDTDAFTINIETKSADQPVFYAANTDKFPLLDFLFANVNIKTTGNNEIAHGFDDVYADMSKFSDNVVIADKTFKKDGNVYKGNLTITAGMMVWTYQDSKLVYMFPDDAADFKPATLKSGKISYDKATNTLTLDNVEIEDALQVGYNNMTLYLKGDNKIKNEKKSGYARLAFYGANSKITGDKNATLTIYCNAANSTGMRAYEGLTISGIQSLEIGGAYEGIRGDGIEGNNNLKIAAPITVYSESGAITGFDDVDITNSDLQITTPSVGATWNTTNRQFEDDQDNLPVMSLVIRYPKYGVSLGDTDIDAGNAADIKVADATGKASYDKATKTLTLTNFVMTKDDSWAGIATNDELTIVLIGDNEVKGTGGIEANGSKLTITGNGSLKATGLYNPGIKVTPEAIFTIQNGATVIAEGPYGLSTDATLMCSMGMGPDYELENPAATLIINNATLRAKGLTDPSLVGFTTLTLKDAKLTAPENAEFFAGCNMSEGMAGIIVSGAYVSGEEVVISKTGASAIENTSAQSLKGQKTIINGQLFILVGEHTYDAQGQMVH